MNVEPYPIKTNDYKVPVNFYSFEAVKAAEREAVIDRVLEIIKEEQDDDFKRGSATNALVANTVLEILADRVLALKGEQV